jgi:hypothetical protein
MSTGQISREGACVVHLLRSVGLILEGVASERDEEEV